MGLKFLRDGIDSANLVSMWSLEGQPGDWNLFANEFFTHIGAATSLKTKALVKRFSAETEYVQEIGLSNMAEYDTNGKEDAAKVVPFSLTFKPNS